MGIDPGLARLGWSVLLRSSTSVSSVHFGCLETKAHTSLSDRLLILYSELKNLLSDHQPDVLALETLFFVKNAKALAQVGHSRGVILLAAAQAKLPVFEYAPRQIKLALTGFGGAEKPQMQMMTKRLLNLTELPQPDDAADACAVALCHAQYAQSLGKSAVTV
jgi:crossover junction endodeoxyribonuclease RuvC